MLVWQATWKAVSAKVTTLMDVANLYLRGPAVSGSDSHNTSGSLIAYAKETFNAMRAFEASHGDAIPAGAAAAVRAFLAARGPLFDSLRTGIGDAWTAIVLLGAATAEVEYHLSDRDPVVLRVVDRAFVHLQRSIIADPDAAAKWQAAFDEGETRCEQLGAVHLLLHGIWAFKTSGEGERTDLVLGEKLEITADLEKAADALVLTEWKRIVAPGEAMRLGDQAVEQARLYSGGLLAGFELTSHRYIVLVSGPRLERREPIQDRGVTYHFVNIAVGAATPSRERSSTQRRR